MGILEWASHFKNIRCVLFFDPESPLSKDAINWIVKKHRWRQIGLGKSICELDDRFKKHPFVLLSYPAQSIYEIAQIMSEDTSYWIVESVILALCYSAPLICFKKEDFLKLEPFLTWVLKAEDVPESEVMRHLRIAGYVPIDFFSQVKDYFLILKEGDKKLKEAIEKRKKDAESDGKKRFWRIKEKDNAPPFIGYVDLLPVFLQIREKIKLSAYQDEFCGLLLSITTVLNISI